MCHVETAVVTLPRVRAVVGCVTCMQANRWQLLLLLLPLATCSPKVMLEQVSGGDGAAGDIPVGDLCAAGGGNETRGQVGMWSASKHWTRAANLQLLLLPFQHTHQGKVVIKGEVAKQRVGVGQRRHDADDRQAPFIGVGGWCASCVLSFRGAAAHHR